MAGAADAADATTAGAVGERVILHVDMDAFFVSVELRRRPELVGLPVVVGGTGPRGVVAAASYEARRYGVHSALPSTTARRLCPSAVFLPGDHELYASVSTAVNRIFHDVTPLVEPLSLDEAFLDVTGATRLLGDGVTIAHHIRARTVDELQLTCSVGVAPSKFLAKLASEAAKPRATPAGVLPGAGVVHIEPGEELAFLHPLPVHALWGVGPATLDRLTRIGVQTIGDLAELGEATLVTSLGASHGRHLHRLAQAIDDRSVEPDREAKSIGHEETFATDRFTHGELRVELVRLADGVAGRLRAHGCLARTVTLKVRFAGFATITRAVTMPGPSDTAHGLVQALEPLLAKIDPTPGVRLLGVSASNFVASGVGAGAEQLSLDQLFEDAPAQQSSQATAAGWHAAEATVDAIRRRFGATVIGPASSVGERGLRVVRRGQQQWGPDQHPDSREKGR
ncbi:MAG: dinB [Ilumatobacteraceae bacterium]|nr:dinB [Ilumatobacteraceae bacterium]